MFLLGVSRLLFVVLPAVASIAWAQTKTSPMLLEKLPPSVSKQTPIFIFGDSMSGQPEQSMVIEGNAEIRKIDTVIKAQRLEYNQTKDTVHATGEVQINKSGNRYWGPELELGVTDFLGFFSQPNYQFLKNGAQGAADRVDFVGERMAIAKNATFSTCKRTDYVDGKPWKPDWILRADEVRFNIEEDIATATGATLRFKDVPILAVPGFSFPMSDRRKSGLLAPTLTSDSRSGFEYTQPYYWNIAPNRDATFLPTYISKRGLDYGAEFRYLEPNFSGQLRGDYLANDALYGSSRWGFNVDQRALLRGPTQQSSDIQVRMLLNRVSDDNYWRDFPTLNSALTQRLLNNEINTTTNFSGWASQFRVQRWQTLQDTTSPITPPYDRTQLATKRSWFSATGFQAQVDADFTEFNSNASLTGQPNGKRLFTNLQMSKVQRTPSSFITPKIMLNATAYQFDTPFAGTTDTFKQRVLPTVSLDSGLFFEREANLFSGAYNQTLEPRAFYVRTPYRDQSGLPNYDSGAKDYSLSTIFSENPFVGNDRIADMNALTLGLTTRFLNPQTGAQALSAGVAQRYSFSNQQVTLPGGTPPTTRLSNWLFNTNVSLQPSWSIDGTVQLGSTNGAAERTTVTSRFSPSNYRSVFAAYRMQQGVSEQIDMGWQWPLGDLLGRSDDNLGASSAGRGLGSNRWYTLGRLNYSTFDQRMVGAIAGFEYDADCWVGRVVLEQTQLDVNTTNRRIMFQLELVGFSRVGISPLASLRSNIPRYQNLREQITSPSRFSQYD